MLPGGMDRTMSLPKAMEYFSSPSPKASNAPQVSNTVCHAVPRKRSSVLPECSYCPACFRNSTNALLTVSQSTLAAAAKNAWNSDGILFVAAFACASFSATNDFNCWVASGFFSDHDDGCCLVQPAVNNPKPRIAAPRN